MRLNTPIKLFPLLFTIVTILILLVLGLWQLYRLKEKNFLLSAIKYNLNTAPINLNDIDQATIYSKIKIQGQFLIGKDIHLYRHSLDAPGQNGYYFFTPFKTNNNQIILVARGWFDAIHKKDMQTMPSSNSSYEEIIGIALPGEKKQFFVPTNDLKDNIWFVLDLEQISQILELKLVNIYLLQLDQKDIPKSLISISTNNLTKIKNDHLEYSLTWFGLAIALGAIFIIYHTKKDLE